MTLLSRAEAQALGRRTYFDGKPCRNGHVAERLTNRGYCSECAKAGVARWRLRFPKRHRSYSIRWRRRNPERALSAGRHAASLRRARQFRATPEWVDAEALRRIFDSCPVGMEVDHIVPLNSAIVCGLHVPWNLQYLQRSANRAKGNRLQ